MEELWPIRYSDDCGTIDGRVRNNGRYLAVELGGVTFGGRGFDSLAPSSAADPQSLSRFRLSHGCLCSCTLNVRIPITIGPVDRLEKAILQAKIVLGNPTPRNGLDREDVVLQLPWVDQILQSSGTSGWFEDELLEIQRQLPAAIYIKACINCRLSDYSLYGHGSFGDMACFRERRDTYLSVKNKLDILRIWPSLTEYVQETYLCPSFEKRPAGTGYRG